MNTLKKLYEVARAVAGLKQQPADVQVEDNGNSFTVYHAPSPGPWRVDDFGCVCGSGKVVAALYDLRDDDTGEEQEANARLIAAAPDLLEALKEALDQLESWNQESEPTFTMRRVAHAIAKATGTTNL